MEFETLDQLRVQLAGCLLAAEGAKTDVAKKGMYGWSPAYQAILDLRKQMEEYQTRAKNAESFKKALLDGLNLRISNSWHDPSWDKIPSKQAESIVGWIETIYRSWQESNRLSNGCSPDQTENKLISLGEK